MTTAAVLAKLADRDPDGAIQVLLGRYDPIADASRLVGAYYNARRRYLNNDSNRRAEYEQEIRALIRDVTSASDSPDTDTEEDIRRLNRLLTCSLLEQNRVYGSPKSQYLLNEEADQILHTINPACKFFYDYVLPESIILESRKTAVARRVTRMLQADGKEYNFQLAELEEMVRIARDELNSTITRARDYYRMIIAVQLVSGRRTVEVLQAMHYSAGPTPFQARVSGITKGRALKHEEVYNIPLLVPYSSFASAMDKIRAYRTIEGTSFDKPMTTARCSILHYAKQLFGRSLTHTQKRNIYLEMAYRDKENNGFIAQGCSREAWCKLALCQDLIFRDATSTYQAMTVE